MSKDVIKEMTIGVDIACPFRDQSTLTLFMKNSDGTFSVIAETHDQYLINRILEKYKEHEASNE